MALAFLKHFQGIQSLMIYQKLKPLAQQFITFDLTPKQHTLFRLITSSMILKWGGFPANIDPI